jgi:2-haloacid dehalogenase
MFTANLPRILLIAGVVPNTGAALFTAPELLPIVMTLTAMTARPSLAGCSSLLHSIPGRFQLMAATNGGDLATRGLFKRALGEEEAGKWKYFSCDSIQLAKPDPKVYDAIWAGFEGGRQSKGWFIASHTWCVSFILYRRHLLKVFSLLFWRQTNV